MNSHAITQAYKPLLIFTVLLITFCSLGLQKKPPAKPKATPRTHTIAIRGFEFVPATLTINSRLEICHQQTRRLCLPLRFSSNDESQADGEVT